MSNYQRMTKAQLIDELRKQQSKLQSPVDLDHSQKLDHELSVYQIELEMQNQELRETQQKLEDVRDHYADLYDFAPVGYATFNTQGVIEEINLTGASWLGRPRHELIGSPFSRWLDAKSLPTFFKHLQRVFRHGNSGPVADEVTLQCTQHQQREVMLESAPICNKKHNSLICRTALMDISERKKNEHIQYLAYYDQLTGLPNRMLLQDRLMQAISGSQRANTPVALLFLDLDRFKNINDSLGHAAGDLLLQETAQRLQRCVRKIDTVARLSGDEFILVLPEIANTVQVRVVIEHIFNAMTVPFYIAGHKLTLSASVGISIYPDDGTDVQSLIRNADAAMYHAKKDGRNRFRFYTEDMNIRALEALSFENSLRRALEGESLEVHYQPQVDVLSGRIIGLEALIRWYDPAVGWIPPMKIIPFAEERGLIEPIFDWVLRTTCEQSRAWQNAGLTPIPIAVNICALQVRQKGFAKKIARTLESTGMDARFLELELTESVLMQDSEATIAMVRELQHMGLQLSIDDFGTGYSSLSYLRQLPINKLKIDQSFISDVTTNPDAAAITSAIISMAKNLKLRALAEGVETKEQLSFLQAQKCDEIQGFYFSEALPPERCAQLLREDWSMEIAERH
ncbi:MAG: EAL domain-containing protein [Pseudomonadota bacterium]